MTGLNSMRRPVDWLAVLILLTYAILACLAQAGTGAAFDRTLAAARARGTLRVAIDVGYRPFSDLVQGEIVGYDADLAHALAARLGLRVAFVPTGFDGLYAALTGGRADLVASALPYAPEYGHQARFSSFYFDAGQMLIVPLASPLNGPADLAGHSLGVALGSDADALARRLVAATPQLIVQNDYETPQEVITALRRGDIDAALVDNVVALGALAGGGLRNAGALSFEPYVLAMPAEAFQLQAEVNRALAELQAAGFFDQLNARWFR